MKIKIFMTIGLSALAFAGCETTSNSNVTLRNANSNMAVVVNNNANTPTIINTTTNSNMRNSNVNRGDYDKNRGDYEKDKGSSTIGQGVNDSWLWFKLKTALAAASDLRDSTINVDVVNDVVTLKGSVGTAAEKASAEKIAKEIEGVKSVKNELKVAANDSMTNQMVNGNTSNKSNSNMNKK